MLSIRAMDEALELAKANVGGAVSLARALGNITSQAVSQWKRVPAERVNQVAALSGVSKHALRPDIFGPEPVAADVPEAAE